MVLLVAIAAIVTLAIIMPPASSSIGSALTVTDIATVILATATLYQALKTGDTVTEMREAREQEYSPSLRIFLVPIEISQGFYFPALRVINVGRGPALEVLLNFTLKKNGGDGERETLPKGSIGSSGK